MGRREETQITEVASQKGNLQNGGCRKSSVLSGIFYLPGGGGRKQSLPSFCSLVAVNHREKFLGFCQLALELARGTREPGFRGHFGKI